MSKFVVRADLSKWKVVIILVPLLLAAWVSISPAQGNPVSEAVQKGDMEELKRLLKSGADVNARDRSGNTALASAALLGDEEAAKILLDHGAAVNLRGPGGATPLLLACMVGSPELMRTLLDSGAEVDARGENSLTPLIVASQVGNKEIVRMLLAAGADSGAQDIAGKTPSTYANENGHMGVLRLLLKHENSLNFRVRAFFRSYPFIDPVAFRIGPLGVRWYGLMCLIGAIVGAVVIYAELLRRRGPVPVEATAGMVIYGLIGLIVGGRLGAVLLYYPGYFFAHPWQIFAVWRGGMSFYGALIGIIIAGWILARRRSLPLAEMADICILALPIGIMLVRIGNFIKGELFGTVTKLPWGIVFPGAGSLPRHPSQLYGAFFEGLVLFAVLWLFRLRARRPGEVFALFLVLYGVFRFALEFLREADASILVVSLWLTTGQIFSTLMIIVGVGILFFLRRGKS